MLESKIQSRIIKHLEKLWYTPLKIIKLSKSGYPDLLVLTGMEKHFWIEVKQETGKLSEIQKYRIEELESKGDKVIVAYGYDDFLWKITCI